MTRSETFISAPLPANLTPLLVRSFGRFPFRARQQIEFVALSVNHSRYCGALLRRCPADRYRTLADHAAGNPVASVSGRIGHVVVLAAVDHYRGAVGMEDGVGLGYIDGDCRIDEFDFQRAGRRNVQVRHVAGMTGADHDAVVRVTWIEVRTRRIERRRVAAA